MLVTVSLRESTNEPKWNKETGSWHTCPHVPKANLQPTLIDFTKSPDGFQQSRVLMSAQLNHFLSCGFVHTWQNQTRPHGQLHPYSHRNSKRWDCRGNKNLSLRSLNVRSIRQSRPESNGPNGVNQKPQTYHFGMVDTHENATWDGFCGLIPSMASRKPPSPSLLASLEWCSPTASKTKPMTMCSPNIIPSQSAPIMNL